MRLDFNVLWVDDQPNGIAAQVTSITRRMEDEGFRFNPTSCRSIDEVKPRISDDVFNDEIDLILVDWDLGGGASGQDAIAEIRQTIPYKDVVFYSAQNPAETLRRLASDRGVEGVYCASREDLVDEVIGVFESLVKKVLDLDHTRGIVMGATSDIDQMVRDCLTAAHDSLDGDGKQAMLAEALSLIDETAKSRDEDLAKLKAAKGMAEIFEAHLIFTSHHRLRILARLLKDNAFKDHAAFRPSVTTYLKNVLPRRNDLGHIILEAEGKATGVAAGAKVISLDEMRELRRLILRLRGDFDGLLGSLRDRS
jgi:hypothetical protein